MLKKWKTSLEAFQKLPPGERFVGRYRSHRGSAGRAARIALVFAGFILIAAGAILLVIPGPGLLLIAFGGALVGQEFLWVAKALDRLDLALRAAFRAGHRFWRKASKGLRAAVLSAALLGAAGAAYLGYRWFFER